MFISENNRVDRWNFKANNAEAKIIESAANFTVCQSGRLTNELFVR